MFRIESIWNRNWSITIDTDALIVRAIQDTPCRSASLVREFQAKSIKQAWFAYFNPQKVRGLLKEYVA